MRREADIAIRHARPDQPNLFTKRLRDESMRFFASSAYLEATGHPTKRTVSSHQIVSFVDDQDRVSKGTSVKQCAVSLSRLPQASRGVLSRFRDIP